MTTPTGTISLNDVRTELGVSGVITMNDSNVRTLAGVGGSGTIISMNDLRGKSAYSIVSFSGSLIADDVSSPYNVTAALTVRNDGTVSHTGTPSESTDTVGSSWLSGGGSAEAANWSVRASYTGDAPSTGTTGSWLALSSDRAWTLNRTLSGMISTTLHLAFSRNGGSTTAATIDVYLEVNAGV